LKFSNNSHVLLLIGRVLIAAVFAKAVVSLLTGSLPLEYAAKGANFIPVPALFVWFAFIFKVVAGLSILIGFKTRTAAFVLVVFTVLTAFNFHDIGSDVFMKELSMIGGLLILAAVGPGRWSLDKE